MDSREAILESVRSALGRKLGQKPLPPPEPLLRVRYESMAERLSVFQSKFIGTVTLADGCSTARDAVEGLLAGRTAVASNHAFLAQCGVPEIPGVAKGTTNQEELRNSCASSAVGITSAYCLLAETGSIVLRACPQEPRLLSLLPPVHIALVSIDRLLTNLDEMLSMTPRPVDFDSSAMVVITGPSRTADIEQFLVRGVHGPGEVHVIVVQGKIPNQ
jgi:L-lactate dehydrogenase complex protein LldG